MYIVFCKYHHNQVLLITFQKENVFKFSKADPGKQAQFLCNLMTKECNFLMYAVQKTGYKQNCVSIKVTIQNIHKQVIWIIL